MVRILFVLTAVLSVAPAAAADEPPRPILSPPDPSELVPDVIPGPLFFLTDSVGLGAVEELATASPTRFEHLGYPGITAEVAVEFMNARTAPLGDVAVVALGYNYPYWDPEGFDADIDRLVARMHDLGARKIVWVTLRRADRSNTPRHSWAQLTRVAWYFEQVNQHIEAAVDRHPSVSVADWAAVSARPGLTYDAIHLNPAGQALMTQLVLDEVERAGRRSDAGTHRYGWRVDDAAVAPGGVVVSVDVSDVRDEAEVLVRKCSKQNPVTTSTELLPRGAASTILAAVELGRNEQICVSATDAATLNVRLMAELPANSGLIVAKRADLPGFNIGLDPAVDEPSPIRETESPKRRNVNLKPANSAKIKAQASGRVPVFTMTIAADTDGFVALHDCAKPRHRVAITRYQADEDRTISFVGYAKNRTCLVASSAARLAVEQQATVKPSALTPVRPRSLTPSS